MSKHFEAKKESISFINRIYDKSTDTTSLPVKYEELEEKYVRHCE